MTLAGGVVLVKLGGSLITDKRGDAAARRSVIDRLAGEVVAGMRRGGRPVVLGHGSGSFGHVAAKEGGLESGLSAPSQRGAVTRTQIRARELNALVVDALRSRGAAPFVFAPSSFLLCRDGRVVEAAISPLAEALERGLLPVVFGDVVLDRSRGVSIVSTEAVLLAVADRLRRRGVRIHAALWMGETEGLYDRSGRTLPKVTPRTWATLIRDVGLAAGTDVTGGMRLRVETAARLARRGVPSWILDGRRPRTLERALAGNPTGGTLVTGRS